MQLFVLALVILIVLYYVGSSAIITYIHGIKKTEGITQKKLKIFEIGLLIDLSAVFINVYSQITSNESVGQISDMVFFGFIALGNVVYSIGFLLPSIEDKSCIKCPDEK